MSKDKKDKQQPAKPKKGAVIQRKHNRTVPQGIATTNGKWDDLGGGFFQLKGPGNRTAYVQYQGGKLRSVTKVQVTRYLEEKARAEAQALECDD